MLIMIFSKGAILCLFLLYLRSFEASVNTFSPEINEKFTHQGINSRGIRTHNLSELSLLSYPLDQV